MQVFLGLKMGPFHQRQKSIILCDSKRSSFITDFFELQFDTATLIIAILVPDWNYMQYYYTVRVV